MPTFVSAYRMPTGHVRGGRPAGKGHGSAPAPCPASQRNLLTTLLQKRPGNNISRLARFRSGVPLKAWTL
jgi:hypothetical protein